MQWLVRTRLGPSTFKTDRHFRPISVRMNGRKLQIFEADVQILTDYLASNFRNEDRITDGKLLGWTRADILRIPDHSGHTRNADFQQWLR